MSHKVTSSTPMHSVRPNTNTPFQFQASTEITMKCSTCGKYMTDECRTKFCRRHTGHTGDNINSKHRSICAENILKSQFKYMPIEQKRNDLMQIQHEGQTPDQQQKFTHINRTHTQTYCMNRAVQHAMYKAKGEGCQSQLTLFWLTAFTLCFVSSSQQNVCPEQTAWIVFVSQVTQWQWKH